MAYPFYHKPVEVDKYDIELQLPRFETYDKARKEAKFRIHVLDGSTKEEDVILADKLRFCSDEHWCDSPACPICFREMRKFFFSWVSFLSEHFEHTNIVTVLHPSKLIPGSDLELSNAKSLGSLLRQRLNRTVGDQDVYMIGCLEIDYHLEQDIWLPHYHFAVFSDDIVDYELCYVITSHYE